MPSKRPEVQTVDVENISDYYAGSSIPQLTTEGRTQRAQTEGAVPAEGTGLSMVTAAVSDLHGRAACAVTQVTTPCRATTSRSRRR